MKSQSSVIIIFILIILVLLASIGGIYYVTKEEQITTTTTVSTTTIVLVKTCDSDFDCRDVSIEFKCKNNQCVKIDCISNQDCLNISNSLTCENNSCIGHSCNSYLECLDLNPLTTNFCNKTSQRCSNRIVSCISGDNFCPLNCNDWQLDNDCGGVPQVWNMIASNEPSDYLGDAIYPNKPSDWKHYQPMIDKVNELTRDLTNDYDKAIKIANWVRISRPYNYNWSEDSSVANRLGSVIDIFNEDKGVCLDAGILTTAMLRLAEIPARVVSPAVGEMHQYTEAYLNNKWIGIDATFSSSDADIFENQSAITITQGNIYSSQDVLELHDDTYRNVTKFKSEITIKEFPAKYGYVLYPTTSSVIFYDIGNTSNYSETYKEGYRGIATFGCGVMNVEYDCDFWYCYNKTACPSMGQNESCPSNCEKWCKCGIGNTMQNCAKNQYCCWMIDPFNSWSCGGSPCTTSGPTINITNELPEYQSMWSVGFLFSGNSELGDGRFIMSSEAKNGYIKSAYPTGKYKLSCRYGGIPEVAYKIFEIKEDSEIKITPESLIKDIESSDELFNLLIRQLTKSTKGL